MTFIDQFLFESALFYMPIKDIGQEHSYYAVSCQGNIKDKSG
jgi:hypothetical protein